MGLFRSSKRPQRQQTNNAQTLPERTSLDAPYQDLDALPGHQIIPPEVEGERMRNIVFATTVAQVAYDSHKLNLQESQDWNEEWLQYAYNEIPDPSLWVRHAYQPLNLDVVQQELLGSTMYEAQVNAGVFS